MSYQDLRQELRDLAAEARRDGQQQIAQRIDAVANSISDGEELDCDWLAQELSNIERYMVHRDYHNPDMHDALTDILNNACADDCPDCMA